MRCDDSNQFGWSKGVVLSMWIMNNFVSSLILVVMENLEITQYWNTLHCVTIQGGSYQPWIHGSELGKCVYL